MEQESLVRLERIARNLPIGRLSMCRMDSSTGEIFFAYGRANDGVIHGVWGCRDIGRTLEFKKGTKIKEVKQVLVNDAAGHIGQLIDKGLMSG